MSQIIKCRHCNKVYFEVEGKKECPFCKNIPTSEYDWFKDFLSTDIFKEK